MKKSRTNKKVNKSSKRVDAPKSDFFFLHFVSALA